MSAFPGSLTSNLFEFFTSPVDGRQIFATEWCTTYKNMHCVHAIQQVTRRDHTIQTFGAVASTDKNLYDYLCRHKIEELREEL